MEAHRHHFFELDLLRFFAALLVLLNHFASYARDAPEVAGVGSLRAFAFLEMFEGVGAVGVQIFFVISGFVISASAGHLSGRTGAQQFMRVRLRRLLPALWISTALGAMALLGAGIETRAIVERFLKSVLLLPIGPYVDGVIWTLLLEVVFYLWVAVLLLWGRVDLVRAARWLGGVSAGFVTGLLLTSLFWAQAYVLLAWFPFKLALLHHGVFFALGMLLWARKQQKVPHFSATMFLFQLAGIIQISLSVEGDIHDGLLACLIFGVAFRVLRLAANGRLHVPQFSFFRVLGDFSYPLYLNHYTMGMCLTWATASLFDTPLLHCLLVGAMVVFVSGTVLISERAIRAIGQPRGIFRTSVRPPLT